MLRRELDETKHNLAELERLADQNLILLHDRKRIIKQQDADIERLRDEIVSYQKELETVRAALDQAQKNDSPRDAKTGKFTKRASDVS
jgi:chromosome segregation ATPase